MAAHVVIDIIFSCLTIYSFIGLFSVFKVLITAHRKDELEKKIIVETLAISMITILMIDLIQMILVLIMPSGFKPWISPNSKGFGLGRVIHIDSFAFNCAVLGFTYMIRRYHFGLIKLRFFLIPVITVLVLSILMISVYVL